MEQSYENIKMNSIREENLDLSVNELSNADDDFDNLFREDEDFSNEKVKQDLTFNELFDQISEECTDSVECMEGDIPKGTFEEDFEALVNDGASFVNPNNPEKLPNKELFPDIKSIGEQTDDKDVSHEIKIQDKSEKGFSHIFKSENSVDFKDKFADGEIADKQQIKNLLLDNTLQDQVEALNKLLMEEKNSFKLQIKQKEIEISQLMAKVGELKSTIKALETEKHSSEEKILNLLEKQTLDPPVTAVQTFSLEREEHLLSQVEILKKRIKSQDDIIVEIQYENDSLRNRSNGLEDVMINGDSDEVIPEDSKKKIMLLEHELEDQKEVSTQLKAYVGEVLGNIMITNPHILERK